LKQLQADEADEHWIEVKPDPRKKWEFQWVFSFGCCSCGWTIIRSS
jgi:hypothetical protein